MVQEVKNNQNLPQQQQEPTDAEKQMQERINELEKQFKTAQVEAETLKQKEAERIAAEQKAKDETTLKEQMDIKNLFKDMLDEEPEEKPKLDSLTPKELLGIMTNGVEQALTAQSKQTEQKLNEIAKASDSKVGEIAVVLQRLLAHMDTGSVANKYQDFDQVKPWIEKVNARYPGMNMEDMYQLGKSWMAQEVPPQKVTESELPNDIFSFSGVSPDRISQMNPQGRAKSSRAASVRGGQQQQTNTNPQAGIVQFRDIVQRGVNKVISQRMASQT